MKCPVCNNNEHVDIDLHSDSFTEGIMECDVCESIWSVNHGVTKIIKDTQEKSFLGAASKFYYSFAA